MRISTGKLRRFVGWSMPSSVLLSAVLIASRPPGDEGARTYKAKCTSCHAADGSGNTTLGKNLKIRDLRSADVQKQSDEQLAKIIREGKGKMPAMGRSLSEEQISQTVAYVRDLAKK